MTTNKVCLIAVAWLLVALSGCGADSAQTSIDKSRAALEKGEYQVAAVHVKSALKQDPQSGPARFLLGRLLLAAGDLKGADIELRKALELNHPLAEIAPLQAQILLSQQLYPKLLADMASLKIDDPVGQANLSAIVASAHLSSGQPDKAEALIRRTLAAVPGHVPTQLVEARLAASGSDYDAALKILDSSQAVGVQQAEVWRLRGDLLLYGKNDRAGARAAYGKALEMTPADLYSSSQLISLALLDQDIKSAKQLYAAAAQHNPSSPQTKFLEAHIALVDGNYARARELLAPLLSAQKGEPRVLLLAGATELQLNSTVRAEQHLRRALTANPESADARRLLAAVYLRRGEAGLALGMLRPLLEAQAADADVLMLAAEAHLLAGQVKQAEDLFSRASQLRPGDIRVRTARALLQATTSNAPAALGELQGLATKDGSTLADMALISARLRTGDVDGALDAIAALEKKTPKQAMPHDLRGRVYTLKRDFPKARASFEQALALEPAYFPAAAALAKADLAEGKPDEARGRYEAVLKANPRSVGALVALSGLRAQANAPADEVTGLLRRAIESGPDNAATRVLLVEFWLTRHNPKLGLEAAQAGLAALPDDPALLDALARAQMANGQTSQALGTLGRLALLQPGSAAVHLRMADAYQRAGNPSSAEQSLRQALSIAPDLVDAQRALMVLAIQAKKPEKAIQIAREVQRRHPRTAMGYVLEGDVYLATKQWAAAANAYRAGMQRQGASLPASRLYGLLSVNRSATEAERFAAEWLREHPRDTAVRWLLAQDAGKAGQLDVAEKWYREIVGINPQDAMAVNDLAWVLVKGKKPGALETAQRAVALAPESAAALDTLAAALAAESSFEQAISAAKSAVQLAPEVASMRLNLAKLYHRANDNTRARAELTEITKRPNRSPEYQEAVELLKKL